MPIPPRCLIASTPKGLSPQRFPGGNYGLMHVIAALLFLLPPLTGAAQTYQYTYTGNPFGGGYPNFYYDPYTAEDFIFAKITTPTPLVAGDHNQFGPGVDFSMGDGDRTLVHETTFEPYLELLPQDFIDMVNAEPQDEWFSFFYPNFPYTLIAPTLTYQAEIFIHELDEFGLPAEWDIQLGFHEQLDVRRSRGARIRSISGPGREDVDNTDRGSTSDGWARNHASVYYNPGTWRLTVSDVREIPEPSTFALLLIAFSAMFGIGVGARRGARITTRLSASDTLRLKRCQ